MNLPGSELSGFDRIGTHVEEAHWFYEDFIRPLDPSLPSMNLRNFSLRIFQRCPLTAHCGLDVLEKAYAHWIGYKKRIPVRGAILLNEEMDSVLLVRGYYKGAAWMFPRGKINQGEDDLDCAIREVYEETGFNARDAGLIPENRALKSFEMSIRDQHVKLFVIPNVPMDTHFEPRTRKEIGKIQWYKLADLPGRSKKKQVQDSTAAGIPNANKFYMVASFLEQLNRWIKNQTKKRDRSRHINKHFPAGQLEIEEALTEEEGMATESTAEPRPVFATAESHEAATRELHRLLKIQPPAQKSQADAPHLGQDKGQAILAMLRQTKDGSPHVQASAQSNSHMPHTPMDNVYNIAPEPRTPQYHHPTQRLPPDAYQAPPTFPIQPDMNDQLRSVLGLTGNALAQTTQQTTRIVNHQVTVTSGPDSITRPSLLHPQPLPRQANHILADAIAPTPPVPHNHHVSGAQQMNVSSSFPGGVPLPQQLVPNLRQPPTTLDNTRLALLNAFKTESGSAKDSSLKTVSHQKPTAELYGLSQQQHSNPAPLGSPYGVGAAAIYSGLGEPYGNVMATQRNTQAPASLRSQNISQNQQKALLDIFKQPTALSPSQVNVQPSFKENGVPRQSKVQQSMPGHQVEAGTIPPTPSSHPEPLPYGARSLVTRPKQLSNASDEPYHQKQTLQSSAHTIGGLAVDGASMDNKTQVMRGPSRGSLLGSPYNSQAQLGLTASPRGLPSIPNLIPRHQGADPQQVQRLMSLFSTSAGTTAADTTVGSYGGKGKEPALYDAILPQTSTHVAPMVATPSIDGTGSAHSTSRRGSQQAPISPENEKFLLNYLKTVSSGTK